MTRRSKRELERDLEKLDAGDTDRPIDPREGVTAPFVTYDGGDALAEEEVPDGWVSSTEAGRGGATYHVVERGGNA